MNGITIIIWITIAIIAIIAIILVKLHYKGEELEKDDGSILEDTGSLSNLVSAGKNILSNNGDKSNSNQPATLNQSKPASPNKQPSFNEIYEEPVVSEVNNANYNNIEYESQNQVLVDYGNTVEKFQEPIKQSQMDIMSQSNNPKNEKHELKDLFTIDELIKESKRKDSEREKEAHKNDDEDKELEELKESIKQKQEEKNIEEIIDEMPEETIRSIINESEDEDEQKDAVKEPVKEEKVSDAIPETTKKENASDTITKTVEEEPKLEASTVTSQDIEEAITTAGEESEETEESISESTDITDALLNNTESEKTEEVIKEPILKTPTKVKDDYKFGADLKDENVFGDYDSDLDYRKDLAKITNTIKGSKIFQDVKEKLISEPPVEEDVIEEDFIRNVNEYEDEFVPIINETHADYEATYEEYHRAEMDDSLRQRNSQNVFSIKETAPKPEHKEEKVIPAIKEKPSRDNIKIKLNNNEVVLKKGDEIIFNHQGETYSSQVYAINGDDISVRYRRKNIIIKPSDVKKVY